MFPSAAWILLDGKIIAISNKHIMTVVRFPFLFGETESSINSIFNYYGESSNSNHEGKARESILSRILLRNFVRIRKHNLKRNQHWSIQLFDLTKEREESISRWAKYISLSSKDIYAAVILDTFKDGKTHRTSMDILASKSVDCNEEILVLTESQLSELYNR